MLLGPLLLALTSVNATPLKPVAEPTVATVEARAPTPTVDLSARQDPTVCNLFQFPISSPGADPSAACGGYDAATCDLMVSRVTVITFLSLYCADVNLV
jgi:hypothetical protein